MAASATPVEDTMASHTVCRVDELPVGEKKLVEAGDQKLIVYHLEDGFYATQAACTHIFAPLVKGKIVDGCRIQCPFHRARFDIRTGKVIDWANWPPGLVQMLNAVRGEKDLKTWPVRVDGGQVIVEL
jgi:nitrite reductase/ring-hydroxylating ferredoxin subunit